jgi:hypothetical protein
MLGCTLSASDPTAGKQGLTIQELPQLQQRRDRKAGVRFLAELLTDDRI